MRLNVSDFPSKRALLSQVRMSWTRVEADHKECS